MRGWSMNKRIWQFAILSILFLTLTPVEWGQDSHSHMRPSTPESNWSELIGSMHVMHAAMTSLQPTGDNDADFVRLMLPHHQSLGDKQGATDFHDKLIRRLRKSHGIEVVAIPS